MRKTRTVRLEVPSGLLDKAQRACGENARETVIMGLRLVAATEAYEWLRQYRGTIRQLQAWSDLKSDREWNGRTER
jgi:hypothetical protein